MPVRTVTPDVTLAGYSRYDYPPPPYSPGISPVSCPALTGPSVSPGLCEPPVIVQTHSQGL